MTENLLATVVAWSTGIVAFVLAAWRIGRRVGPFIRRVVHLVDDFAGEPARPGQVARPGLMERLTTVEARVENTQYHVQPNGGGSAHDDLVRKLDEAIRKSDEHAEDSLEQHRTIYRRLNRLEGNPDE